MKAVRHAGAIFIGRYTPEAVGDYIAGPSHVLPTSGSARFSSGLGVFDFLKRTSIVSCTPDALAAKAGTANAANGVTGANGVVGLQIGYAIADMTAKAGFGVLIYLIAKAKSTKTAAAEAYGTV